MGIKASAQPRSSLAKTICAAIRQHLDLIAVIAFALAVLALAQTLFLLLIGPFLKSMFSSTDAQTILLRDLLPPSLATFLPQLSDYEVNSSRLGVLIPGLMVIAVFFKGLAGYLFHSRSALLSLAVANKIRETLFHRIIKQPFLDLTRHSPAYWMSAIMNDTLWVQAKFSDILNGVVKDSFLMLAAFLTIAVVHLPTAAIMLLISPLLAWGVGRIGKRISRFAASFQTRLANLAEQIFEVRKRFDFIKVHKGEALERDKFDRSNAAYFSFVLESIPLRASFAPGLELVGITVLATIIAYFTTASRDSNIGFVIFFAAVATLIRPLRNLGEQLTSFNETKGALDRSATFWSQVPSDEKFKAPGTSKQSAAIKLSNLSVGFEAKQAICHAKGLAIQPGKSIAVVGVSGSGKSTLLRTLAGIVPPLQIDAKPTFVRWTEHASLVSQQPFLFQGSICDNLCYGLESKPARDTIIKALGIACINSEVAQMPAGLDTQIAALDSNLSGGQKQRLAIARSILHDKPVFLFDEITSALDPKLAIALLESLLAWAKQEKKAIILITHQHSHLRFFDELWTIAEGEITSLDR